MNTNEKIRTTLNGAIDWTKMSRRFIWSAVTQMAEMKGLRLSHSQTCLAIQRVRRGASPLDAFDNMPTIVRYR